MRADEDGRATVCGSSGDGELGQTDLEQEISGEDKGK
jgi:hypothetical protein